MIVETVEIFSQLKYCHLRFCATTIVTHEILIKTKSNIKISYQERMAMRQEEIKNLETALEMLATTDGM